MKVAVLGLGYVGTVTAAGLAASGHDVVGVDVDPFKVGCIAAGRSPVIEPGIDELVHEAVSAGKLRATSRIADALSGAEVSLICVGTPSASNGGTDLRYIDRVAADLREAMECVEPPESGHHSVVVRSTVPPGTVGAPRRDVLRRRPRRMARRQRDVPGVPAGGLQRHRLLRPAHGRDRHRRRGHLRPGGPPVLVPRRAAAPGRGGHRRGAQVRVQRVPRHQDLVRQRDRPGLPQLRRRLPRGDVGVPDGREAQHLARPTCAPGSRSAAPACPRTSGRCTTWRGPRTSTCRSCSVRR